MPSGDRKHPYRVRGTEYHDNLRRQKKREQNRNVWVFIIFALLFFWTLVYMGVRSL